MYQLHCDLCGRKVFEKAHILTIQVEEVEYLGGTSFEAAYDSLKLDAKLCRECSQRLANFLSLKHTTIEF